MHGRRQLVPRGVLLSQVTSETYIYNCQWLLRQDRAYYGDCLGNEEEGVGNGRSVCSESSGLQARNNGGDNGLRLRKEEPILETSSQFRLWIVTHPHDAGIPSNQVLSVPGEYVPAPCTHRPSFQPSSV